VLGSGAPWWEASLADSDRDGPYWKAQRFDAALDQTRVPTLLINGWQDLFLEQTMEQYHRLRARDVDVALTIGPWTHARLLRQGASTFMPEAFDWILGHLAPPSAAPPRRHQPVRIWVNEHGWIELPAWPPDIPEMSLYPTVDGRLDTAPPPAIAAPSSFVYDPADPTPTVGGRLLSATGGYRDDTSLAQRSDVLSFTSEPLSEDLFLMGSPLLELSHSSDNPHVDVFVRLCHVDPEGRSTNVSDGYRRLHCQSAKVVAVTIELDPTAHRFPAGARLRVLVAGGSYPRFTPNPGTSEPTATALAGVPSTHFVHHGLGGTTRLVLRASRDLRSITQTAVQIPGTGA
jgi:putative CocE/NonD family hydrolase